LWVTLRAGRTAPGLLLGYLVSMLGYPQAGVYFVSHPYRLE
jgi:hypothetical protein